jgi:hypothetical protein
MFCKEENVQLLGMALQLEGQKKKGQVLISKQRKCS